MKKRSVIIMVYILMLTIAGSSNAANIDPPAGSEVFEVRKVVMSQDNINSSFDIGTMSHWATVNGGAVSTNEIEAADGEYYAKLTAWDTDSRADCRIDTYSLRTVTSPEYGSIFKISGYVYFPGASGIDEPTDAIACIYGVNNGNTWIETLGGNTVYLSESETNQWYYYEFYAQTEQEVFTGISPRIFHYTYGIDTNKIYVGYVDGLKVEQGVYKKLGTVVLLK